MLETILRLYSMAMAVGVNSPLPHLFGPPGCGKSTVVAEAADLIGRELHIINVSRISPLELEGVQMPVPHDTEQTLKLKLLTATFWTQLKDGDILLLDEFLRAFPEVYNGLLDIITSRQVGGFRLPNVFIIAASNSTVAYDKALEDRLLHLPVPDPRHSKPAKKHLAQIMTDALGLIPEMVDSYEMQTVLDTEVLPMYEILDNLSNKSSAPAGTKGHSLRNLIGQAQLRQVQAVSLKELIMFNNRRAVQQGKWQYVFLLDGKPTHVDPAYEARALALRGNDRLTSVQSLNLELNLQLIEMEKIRREKGIDKDEILESTDDPF
jgi:AAA domain (dynein-related subfamily)